MFSTKKQIGVLLLSVFIFSYTTSISQSSVINYEWKQAALGCGGYVNRLVAKP